MLWVAHEDDKLQPSDSAKNIPGDSDFPHHLHMCSNAKDCIFEFSQGAFAPSRQWCMKCGALRSMNAASSTPLQEGWMYPVDALKEPFERIRNTKKGRK